MIPRYRAWDKEFKEMVQVNALVLDEQVIKATYKNGNIVKEDMKNYELMQSTGLFDKNGKEIFEGDIVRFFDSLYTVFYDIEEGSYRLKPHDDRWVVDYMSNFSSEESFEIIGNIYENKEILEKKE